MFYETNLLETLGIMRGHLSGLNAEEVALSVLCVVGNGGRVSIMIRLALAVFLNGMLNRMIELPTIAIGILSMLIDLAAFGTAEIIAIVEKIDSPATNGGIDLVSVGLMARIESWGNGVIFDTHCLNLLA